MTESLVYCKNQKPEVKDDPTLQGTLITDTNIFKALTETM